MKDGHSIKKMQEKEGGGCINRRMKKKEGGREKMEEDRDVDARKSCTYIKKEDKYVG